MGLIKLILLIVILVFTLNQAVAFAAPYESYLFKIMQLLEEIADNTEGCKNE